VGEDAIGKRRRKNRREIIVERGEVADKAAPERKIGFFVVADQ